MAVAHDESFENTTLGSPVSSDNTSFHEFLGEPLSAGNAVLGRHGHGMECVVTPAMNVGWLDANLSDAFGTGSSKRLSFGLFVKPTVLPDVGHMHFAWLSEPTVAVTYPIASLGITNGGNLAGWNAPTLEFGSRALTVGDWHRIVVEVAQDGATNNLAVVVDMWKGDTILSEDPDDRACRLTGYKTNVASLVTTSGWLMFGSHGSWTTATTGKAVVDNAWVDTWPQSPRPPVYGAGGAQLQPYLLTSTGLKPTSMLIKTG